MAIDSNGFVYVASTAQPPGVRRLPSRFWELQPAWGTRVEVPCQFFGEGTLVCPVACAVDELFGRLYVTDFVDFGRPRKIGSPEPPRDCIRVFDLSTGFELETMGSGILQRPKGICVDSSHRVIVADSSNKRVCVFSPRGNLLCKIGRELGTPTGVTTDDKMRLAVADLGGDRVFVFERPGWSFASHCFLPAVIRKGIHTIMLIARARESLDTYITGGSATISSLPDDLLFLIFRALVDAS